MAKWRRREERKFKRLEVRYGTARAEHRAVAIQISSGGAFLTANRPIFAPGSRIVIEFPTPSGALVAAAVVRHAKNIPAGLGVVGGSGMGVELLSPPRELVEFLSSL